MRKGAIAGLLAVLLLAGCGGGEATPPSVEEARITLPAAPGVPGAGYFTIQGGKADALVAVSSPAAARIEMHETASDARGVTSMRPLAEVPLGDEVSFEPGGKHLMVFELGGNVRAGQAIPLTFRFRTAAPVTVAAQVVPPGAATQDMHDGH